MSFKTGSIRSILVISVVFSVRLILFRLRDRDLNNNNRRNLMKTQNFFSSHIFSPFCQSRHITGGLK